MSTDLEEIAEKAAQRAVKTILLQLGIDVENPLSAQKDFMLLREVTKFTCDPEFRRDMEHLRIWRTRSESLANKGSLTVLTTLLAGFFAAAWVGFQQMIGGK